MPKHVLEISSIKIVLNDVNLYWWNIEKYRNFSGFHQKHNIFTALCECTIHISSSENINDVMVTGSFSLVVLLFSKGIITFTNDAKVELRLFFF